MFIRYINIDVSIALSNSNMIYVREQYSPNMQLSNTDKLSASNNNVFCC